MPPQRTTASPLKALRKSSSSTRPYKSSRDDDENDTEADHNVPRLDDKGAIRSLSYQVKVRDVPQIMQYVINNMFEEIPERAGMNSTRVAEVLNFRRSLPPLVTTTHLHALSKAPTSTEREIVKLVQEGVLRKIHIPGRGLGSTAIGELLALTDDWKRLVNSSPKLSQPVKDKYIDAISNSSVTISVSALSFTQAETIELVQAGFLTSAISPNAATSVITPSSSAPVNIATAGTRAATGSISAVGGEGAVHNAGGSGLGARVTGINQQQLNFALPSVGLYLRLLAASRQHVLALLSKSKPAEAPVDLLRERWDGGVIADNKPRHRKGSFTGVLPGRTRKWKQFYGLKFQWVLEECFGTGAIELFETGAVGLGARRPG